MHKVLQREDGSLVEVVQEQALTVPGSQNQPVQVQQNVQAPQMEPKRDPLDFMEKLAEYPEKSLDDNDAMREAEKEFDRGY